MDSRDYADIILDENGVCDICHTNENIAQKNIVEGIEADKKLANLLGKIRSQKKRGKYDCMIGLSGGIDSTYLAWLCKEWGINPLVLHVDGGWNTELSVANIENTISKLGFDLFTIVLDWNQMRDAQRSFMRANVLDIDLPFDNAVYAEIYKKLAKEKINYLLTGHNVATEGFLPSTFTHYKLDSLNLRYIYSHFNTINLKKFPVIGPVRLWYYTKIRRIEAYAPLNWVPFDKNKAKAEMKEKLMWQDYGNKHYENIFTRFYQGFILPEKFKVDKRKPHFSVLISSGQMTREEALTLLETEKPYKDKALLESDKEFFIKKMKMTADEFEEYIKTPPVPHDHYPSWISVFKSLRKVKKLIKR
jgi:N-acetyl sugar amidotransferase